MPSIRASWGMRRSGCPSTPPKTIPWHLKRKTLGSLESPIGNHHFFGLYDSMFVFGGCEKTDSIWAKPTWIHTWSTVYGAFPPAAYLGLDLPSNPQNKRMDFRPRRLLNGVRCWSKSEALSVQHQWIVVHTSNWGLSPDAHAFLQNSLWANWSMIFYSKIWQDHSIIG